MTPEQLEKEIGISTKQQSVLRTQERFPIPHKKVGRSVLYSIIHIADFLIDGEVYIAPNKKYEPKPAPKISRSKSNQDLSHLFLLKAFSCKVQIYADEVSKFSESFIAYANSKQMYDELELKLETHSKMKSDVFKI